MVKNGVQTWDMRSPSPLAQAVAIYGRELAIFRGLLEEAGHDTIKLHQPRGQNPKGTAMSALTRPKLLDLAKGSADLATAGMRVRPRGEDWVRVWLPKPLQAWVPVRSRPDTIVVDGDVSILCEEDEDLLGMPMGYPYLFWRWDYTEQRLMSFSAAWVKEKRGWHKECPCREEIEISAALAALPANTSAPIGARNEDDELDDLVAKWDTDEPLSEDQVTDKANESVEDGDTNPALGEGS